MTATMEIENKAVVGPTALDDFMFDLNGYLVLKNAVGSELLGELNTAFDEFPPLEYGQWWRGSQRRDYNKETGYELHNIVACGGPFATLIDHPGWIDYVKHYCGEEDSYIHGLFIDEAIASIRKSGGSHPVHSGGFRGAVRGMYQYKHGVFRCGQCNIILALRDIGPGDGPTYLVPGSHKSNMPHPGVRDPALQQRVELLPGAVPVYLNAGDAVLFVDGVMHGGSSRTNPEGERRVTIYRYGPQWGATRYGYQYSEDLLGQLTPSQRKILQPVPPSLPLEH